MSENFYIPHPPNPDMNISLISISQNKNLTEVKSIKHATVNNFVPIGNWVGKKIVDSMYLMLSYFSRNSNFGYHKSEEPSLYNPILKLYYRKKKKKKKHKKIDHFLCPLWP